MINISGRLALNLTKPFERLFLFMGDVAVTRTVAEKRAAFHALHEKGCSVLPNP
jgi:hypothetical protein